jgi:UDP-N-acetylmuramoylalanine--D-glutamate ligase
MAHWDGKRVLVIGAARQGLATSRYLVNRGAQVILNDQRPTNEMSEAIHSLENLSIDWVLGSHPLRLLEGVDCICVSGGVSLSLPLILEALRRGIPLTNDSQIFMQESPCPMVGITGSTGKTTTTTLVGRIANSATQLNQPAGKYRKIWVGGNIGLPLISKIDEMDEKDLVIMEISSFQLELLSLSPWVSTVLNITPNHLDRHQNMNAYSTIKARILDFQTPEDFSILNREDPGSWGLRNHVHGKLLTFGVRPPISNREATYAKNDSLYLRTSGQEIKLMNRSMINLRGEHNIVNILAACIISHAAGLPPESMQAGIIGFTGVPHRLQFIRKWAGADWYNDSIATAPERTMAAIRSFTEPLILLLGGRDKNLPWDDLAGLIHQRVDHVVVFGEAAEKIQIALGESHLGHRPFSVTQCTTLRQAVQFAASLAQPGQVVLLSPGGTSFDEFRDFEERGERFEEWVKELS